MKRLHVHVTVAELERSVDYYRKLFGTEPDKLEADYARWRLDDPAVNFAISLDDHAPGVSHLGLDLDERPDLDRLDERLGDPELSESDVSCCYARSDKRWFNDPDGVSWELFHSHGASVQLTPKTEGCCAG